MRTEELGPSLLAAFARVPDVRSRHGRRSPLPALLTLATAAMLAGARSLYAIVQWGQLQPTEVQRALGFTRGRLPAIATRHYAFKRLEVLAFEAVLQAWATQALGQTELHLVLDGKALRGIHGDEVPGVRLVAIYAPEAGLVLAPAGGQDPGGAGGNPGGQGTRQAGSRVERGPTLAAARVAGGAAGER